MAMRKVTRRRSRSLTMWDVDRYFDATFTARERQALQTKLMDVCGYGGADSRRHLGIPNYVGFDHDIFRPAQDVVWPVFVAQGLDYDRDHARLCDYTLIHICRELEIDYQNFSANAPKLAIAGFVECAKRSFPDFRKPRNKIEAKIQEHKLHALWVDWSDAECVRTGCTCESHWLCKDRFVDRDYSAILGQIAGYNEARPKFAPPKLVYSSDRVNDLTAEA